MDIRPPRTLAEFRAALRVNRAGWLAAYRGLVPDDVLDGFSIPEADVLREDYHDAVEDGFIVLAVDEAEGTVDGTGNAVAAGVADDVADGGSDAAVVGLADVYREATKPFVPEDCAELRAIYVDPERWREGVGSRLLDAVLDRVAADRLVLETLAENDDARSFYRENGFDEIGENAFEVGGESYPTVVYARRV